VSNELKQRFVDLKVNEISLVDTPANEVEILVMKNKKKEGFEGESMEEKVETKKSEGVEVIPIEIEASNDLTVTKALEQVASIVENIAKSNGVTIKTEKKETTEEKTEETTEEVKTEKAEETTEEVKTEKAEETTEVTEEVTEETTEETKVEKSSEELEKETLEVLEQAISKAKRFTPTRIEQLTKAVETLQILLSGIGKTEEKKEEKKTEKAKEPKEDDTVQQLTKAVEKLTEVVTKSVDDNKKISERLETIEKSRTPSQSLEDEGTDKNIEKSFWKGVI
jgi:hypothetical protein